MRKTAFLVLWVLGILLPMGWFAHLSPQSGQLFDEMFRTLWTHVVMHAVLYAVLACLMAYQLVGKDITAPTRRVAAGTLTLVLVVAIVQEGIQLFYQARLPGGDEVFDLAIDMVGGSLGIMLFLSLSRMDRFFEKRREDLER